MDEDPPQSRAEYMRGVAETLRGIANKLQYDFRRKDQLLALAQGFERFAERLEQQGETEDSDCNIRP